MVPAAKFGDDMVGSELLLPLQQRGFYNEGEWQAGKRVLYFPVGAVEQQVGALQEHPALFFVIVEGLCKNYQIGLWVCRPHN